MSTAASVSALARCLRLALNSLTARIPHKHACAVSSAWDEHQGQILRVGGSNPSLHTSPNPHDLAISTNKLERLLGQSGASAMRSLLLSF
jgi:hypothetical protein